jgi:hypothetical protein
MGVAQKKVRSAQTEADAGSVADGRSARTWAGRGKGARCDLCKQPIEADQIEYELELSTDPQVYTADPQVRNVKLHFHCYEQWILLQEATAEALPAPEKESS